MTKISAVFNVKKSLAIHTENCFYSWFDVISFKHLPNDDELKKKRPDFAKLLKQKKAIDKQIGKIRNEHG